MASVTQTIPQFSLGMSEQPDNLKFPGQVTDIVNAIPDVTLGLFKRPGSKRIGTNALTNVYSDQTHATNKNGSWFHYFRDEQEGSYIGQVDRNGVLRVWSCKTGTEMTTAFAVSSTITITNAGSGYTSAPTVTFSNPQKALAENKATGTATIDSNGTVTGVTVDFSGLGYTSAPTISFSGGGGSSAAATATLDNTHVANYLTTLEPENLQFLTINDTTFVNNRDSTDARKQYTTVGETGSSAAAPNTHFAMLELLRTENGRQYGLDIFNTADVSNLSRATRIKIQSDTLYEGDGSGSCPGIGTQVFSVDDGDKKNLIFRINTLGQQGVSPNYDSSNFSNGPDGDNYRCAYQREIVLLHGGEGWAVGDTVTVTLDSAQGGGGTKSQSNSGTNATYTIRVEEVETTQVNATVDSTSNNNTGGDGLIRPEPTPFDAQTAVTADTILGGLREQINAISGISCKVIGNGIYIFSDSTAFTVNVVENDLMRVMQSSVNDVQSLPNQCKHGYIVRVSNALRSEEDDYYLRFDGQNGKDGSGSWSECAKSGITTTLTNMPLVIQRSATDAFTVKQFEYGIRDVGDTFTNPMPSFKGKRINKVLFFRNRLAFLAGENVITSRPGTLARPNFFIETALTVSVADPVDISAASTFPSDLFDGIEINAGLLVFSTNQQFLLASDDTVFNPDTAKLRSIATFNYNENMPPISLGTTVAYIDNSGKFSRFNEMANSAREGEPNIIEVSKVVPTLLPKDIDLMTNSRENSIVLIGKTGTDTVFGYKYFQTAEKRSQAAWFKWKLNNPLIYHFIVNDEYFFLDSDYYLQSVKLVQTETDPSIVQNNVDFLLHVDNHTTIFGGNYDATSNTTTFSSVGWLSTVTSPNHELVVIDTNTSDARKGRYCKATLTNTANQFTLVGDWQTGVTSNDPLTIGYIYPYEVKIPTLYPTKVDGARSTADVNSSLVLHRVKLHFGKIGLYETTLERVGKNDYTEIYESTELDEYEASDAPYLEEFIKTIPVYEKNTNVEIKLKSSHPAPATLRSLSWEGDYSPKYYRRV